MRYLTLLTPLLVLFLSTQPALAQHEARQLGEVDFETSCNDEAQEQFETGIRLLHHMMYEQSAEYFSTAADADPSCTMAHWGTAMTQLRPLWYPPNEQQFERGRAAAQEAATLEAPTDREQMYINAINAYYTTAEENGHRAGLQAWEDAHEELRQAYPDDVEAGAFWALSHLAMAPPDDDTFAHQQRAGTLLEDLLEEAPEHPGLFHYTIHAYDNPALAEQAIEVAREYDQLAPDVPHALHMPSHIFVRLGIWPDVIDWNRRSADAALQQSVGEHTSHHHAHALDYLMYAHLQQGQDEKAREVLAEIESVDNYEAQVGAAYNVPAARARYALERRAWDEAARLTPRLHSNFPWNDFPQFEALIYWARGLGAARTEDLEAARSAVETLRELHRQTVDKDENYWARLVDVQRKTVEAWMLYKQGAHNRALALMREAADQEDAVDKHPVTPSEVLPARELYGDMLLSLDRPEEAIEAYETTLEISPNRFNSLYGAGRAAEMAGQHEVARDYYAQLEELASESDSERERLARARQFLAEN